MIIKKTLGFTLIEITLAMMIVGIIGVTLVGTLSGGARAFISVTQLQGEYGSMRIAVARLANEMRWIRRDPFTPADYDIGVMNAGLFRFTNEEGVTVTLNVTGSSLVISYNTVAGNHTLLNNLNSASFSYFDANGAPTNSRTNIRRVSLSLDSNAMTTANVVSIALRH